jgi:hypothetical protein
MFSVATSNRVISATTHKSLLQQRQGRGFEVSRLLCQTTMMGGCNCCLAPVGDDTAIITSSDDA